MSKKNFKHLVLGAKYKDRDGSERGPLIESGNETYPFKCSMTGEFWTDKGRYDFSCKSRLDLVELVSLPETQAQKRKVATTPEPFIPFSKGKENMAEACGVDEERVEAIGVLVKAAFDAGPDIETALANASSIAKTPAEAFLVGIETRGYLKTGKKKKKKSDREADGVARSLQDALRKQGIIATVTAEKIGEAFGSTEDDCQCFICRARRKAEEHTHNPYAPVEPVNDAKGH